MRLAAILMALAAFACGASAQAQTGTLMPHHAPTAMETSTRGGDRSREMMDRYAACLLDRYDTRLRKILAMSSGSREQAKELLWVVSDECVLVGAIRFDMTVFRGSLFTALVKKEYPSSDAVLPSGRTNFVALLPANEMDPSALGAAQLLTFSSCVINLEPKASRMTIVAPVGSPQETAALAALSPTYSQCLAKGDTIKFSKTILLGLLAEAYYREAVSARSPGAH